MKKILIITAVIAIFVCGCTPAQIGQDLFEKGISAMDSVISQDESVAEQTVTQQTDQASPTSSEPSKPTEQGESQLTKTDTNGNYESETASTASEPANKTDTLITEGQVDSEENKTDTSEQPPFETKGVIEDIRLEVFRIMNTEREAAGVAPLKLDDSLYECAKIRAEEADVYWSHTRPDGRRCFTVFDDYCPHARFKIIGENLCKKFYSAKQAMDALMNSQGHRENILNEDFEYVALAVLPMADNPDLYILAQLFFTPSQPK